MIAIEKEISESAASAATATAKISAVLGVAGVAAAFIPGGQPLAVALGGASMVFAGISTLYNAKAYGWGSSQFRTGVAGMALSVMLGGMGIAAGSMARSTIGKNLIGGVHGTVSPLVGWFTA